MNNQWRKKTVDRKKTVIIGISVVIAVLLTAALTVVVLRTINEGNQEPLDAVDEVPAEDTMKDIVSEEAKKIEEEADSLIESDPLQAAEKYREAAESYAQAGNQGKSADMLDNAKTAESMVPAPELEFGDPVITR